MDASVAEYQESNTIRFEWTISDLKNVFEASKGETKSKVTKSMKFGGGRWQILFYANSGMISPEVHTFISLYLSCEPTTEEKDNAPDGKWIREGLFKFGFELRSVQRHVLISSKEANDHSFSHKTQNWGWSQFAHRDVVYYNCPVIKSKDAFTVICTITSSPNTPVPPPLIPHQHVPRDLLHAVGGLLDDPIYSDVEFILPGRGRSLPTLRKIYAARRLLERVDYFDTMFSAGFAEGVSNPLPTILAEESPDADITDSSQDSHLPSRHSEDSDDEDEEEDCMAIDTEIDPILERSSDPVSMERGSGSAEGGSTEIFNSWTSVGAGHGEQASSGAIYSEASRDVRFPLSSPSTPRGGAVTLEPEPDKPSTLSPPIPGPAKTRVVVRDTAYATYRAVLYYIYTDTIVFAPLSSSFLASSAATPKAATSSPATPVSETQAPAFTQRPSHQQAERSTSVKAARPSSRREWIAQWEKKHFGRPRPCSAKAVYKLADKLDLQELKQLAFQHIVKSLTVDNIAYEVFSTFSAAFEDVRKVQVRFFLDHWNELRASDAMRNVWQQIRLGRHPGFEEVWPVIALNLEFKPQPMETSGENGRDSSTGQSFGQL